MCRFRKALLIQIPLEERSLEDLNFRVVNSVKCANLSLSTLLTLVKNFAALISEFNPIDRDTVNLNRVAR